MEAEMPDNMAGIADNAGETPDNPAGIADKWTIRGVPPEERNGAKAAADRADMTIGAWVARAIRTQIQADMRGGQLTKAEGHSKRLTQAERFERTVEIVGALRDLGAAGVPVSEEHAKAVTGALVALLPGTGRKRGNERTVADVVLNNVG